MLEATVPDPGTGVAGWYERRGAHCGGWADTNYAELLRQSSHGSSAHRSTITISLDMRRAAKAIREAGRGTKGAAVVLRGQMEALEYSLRAADLHVERWLDADALAVIVRQAYDPAAQLGPNSPGATLDRAGPVAVSEHWSYLRHDSGFSTVLWISEWPRQDVAPNFLHSVVFAPGVRRSLSLVAHPLGTQEALRRIRKEKTEAITDSAQRAKIGQIQDLSDHQQYEDVLTREQALVSGHADAEFSGFVVVTAPTRDQLAAAVAQIEQAACPGELRDPGALRAPGSGVRGRRPSPGPFGHVRIPLRPNQGARHGVEQTVLRKKTADDPAGPSVRWIGQRLPTAGRRSERPCSPRRIWPEGTAVTERSWREASRLAQRRTLLELRRREIDAVKAEQRGAAYLPRGGETGARGSAFLPQAEGSTAPGNHRRAGPGVSVLGRGGSGQRRSVHRL